MDNQATEAALATAEQFTKNVARLGDQRGVTIQAGQLRQVSTCALELAEELRATRATLQSTNAAPGDDGQLRAENDELRQRLDVAAARVEAAEARTAELEAAAADTANDDEQTDVE